MTSRSKMFVGILLILAMELIDITVLNNILSDIAHSFAISPFDAKLAITSYTITFGVFLPISVWVSDRFGYYTPLIIALMGFIGASVMCGLSVNLWMLVAFRLLQGFFAALLLPIAQSTMIRLADSMVEVSARIGMYTVGAAAIGQLIGAFLTQYVTWRLVFFLNVPIGLIGMYLIIRYYDVPFEKVKTRLDWIGFLVVGSSIGSLFVLSNIVADQHVAIYIKILLFVVPIVASSLYFINLKKITNPIINFYLFKKANYTIMSFIKFMNKLSLYWLFFALPIYLYIYIGFPMTQVAVIMVTIAAGGFFSKRFAVGFTDYVGLNHATIASSGILMVIMLTWGMIIGDMRLVPYSLILIPLFGVAIGIFQTATKAYTFMIVSNKDKSDSNVIGESLTMIGSAFSISFLGIVHHICRDYLLYKHKLALFMTTFEYSFIICGIAQFMTSLLIVFVATKSSAQP